MSPCVNTVMTPSRSVLSPPRTAVPFRPSSLLTAATRSGCAEDASAMRALWAERDPRVPPQRRIDADGRPSVEDVRKQIGSGAYGVLPAVVERSRDQVVGYCGLVETDCGGPGEPELAYELLGRVQGRGYATEAARTVVEQARSRGCPRLWATVWDWNFSSHRVLEKLGFVEAGERSVVPSRGVNLTFRLALEPATREQGWTPGRRPIPALERAPPHLLFSRRAAPSAAPDPEGIEMPTVPDSLKLEGARFVGRSL